ncbi:hypothetical protein ACQ859_27810 [Roseateles chitinivorans]|uniref:hypothetical protein n=1 Tax=Roseateles chitinivorans TaxID=2917965 RepID=UPI003D66E2B6
MEIDVFLALKNAGVPEEEARSAATAIRTDVGAEIREATKEMATKTDVANLKGDLFQRLLEMQRSTVATMFGGFGMLAALIALIKFVS